MRTTASIFCLLTHWIPAQEVLWQRIGIDKNYQITGLCVFIGDVNGDGHDEVITTAADLSASPNFFMVLSGKDGSTMRTVRAPTGYLYWGQPAATGDMNGDGVRDYAVYRYGSPYAFVEVRSGKDDRVIWQVRGLTSDAFGQVIVGNLDIDNDNKPDLLVGARPAKKVYAFSNSGQLISRYDIKAWRMAGIDDFDKDGHDDFLVDPGYQPPDYRGSVVVHSGKTGQQLQKVDGQRFDFLGSGTIASCGDIDADGVPDIIASSSGGYQINGLVRVFSGKTARQIYAWRRGQYTEFGAQLVTGVDLDLDGVSDLLVFSAEDHPSHPGVGGAVHWYSLREGSLVTELYQSDLTTGTAFGHDIAIGRPQPGSPFPVFLCSEPRYDTGNRQFPYPPSLGRLTLFRSSPTGVKSLGAGCVGTLGDVPRIGLRDLGKRGLRIHVTNAPPNATALLMAGLSSKSWRGVSLPFALGGFGFPRCRLYTSVDVTVIVRIGGSGNDRGFGYLDVPIPLATSLPSFTLQGQWLVPGSGSGIHGGLSGALSWQH